jgi:hypothetical protein
VEQPDVVLTDDDVRVVIEALFGIRTELRAIVALLEVEDDAQGSDEADS